MRKTLKFLLLTIISFAFFGLLFIGGIKAGVDDNVWGWAWSENIDWISFNSTNCDSDGDGITDTGNYLQCPTGEPIANYGVHINDNGIFSGYTWSENIGWITFNENELSGCFVGSCRAEMNLETGEVSGWARACSVFETGCSGVLDDNRGGWDGWISLRGSALDGSSYGVSLNLLTREFEGWAWGGDDAASTAVIGWISWNCNNPETGNVCADSNYKVETSFSLPPVATDLNVEPMNYCTIPVQHFTWKFEDPDPYDTQGAYRLQVDKQGDWVIEGGEFDSGKVYSDAEERQVLVTPDSEADKLDYNTTYYWRLRVWDQLDTTSTDWFYGEPFQTKLHRYPEPNFTWLPESPTAEEVVQFCSAEESGVCPDDLSDSFSVCYNINNEKISCSGRTFFWTFPEGTTFTIDSSETSENPRVKFDSLGEKIVTLEITDDAGSCSSGPKNVGVAVGLPRWREITP